MLEELIELEAKRYENIPKWLSRSENLIYEERKPEFEAYINKHIVSCYRSNEMDIVFNVMEALEKGLQANNCVELTRQLIADSQTKIDEHFIYEVITYFSKQGVKFYCSIHTERPRSPIIKHLENENAQFEINEQKKHATKQTQKQESTTENAITTGHKQKKYIVDSLEM